MNNKPHIRFLPLLMPAAGLLGGILWALMMRLCMDEKGLLKAWNLPHILLLILCAGAVAAVILLTRKLGGSNRYSHNFHPSLPAGISSFAAAAGIVWMMVGSLKNSRDVLASIWMVLGFLSIPALVLAGISRIRGKRPFFLLYGVVSIFFGIHMAHLYRQWSSNPLLAEYAYALFACVFLTLFAYCLTAFSAGMGRRIRCLTTGLLAAFFAMIAAFQSGMGLFYPLCGIWAALNLCDMQPKPRRAKPKPEEPAPEEASTHKEETT